MKYRKIKITRTQVITAAWAGAFVLVMVAFGGLVWWLQHQAKPHTDPNRIGSPSDNTLPSSVADVQNKALSGATDQAVQAVQQALTQSNLSTDEKQLLLVEQGVAYSNAGQYQKALESYTQADTVKSDSNTSHLIAEAYEALGDKPKAIEYYKKTLTQLDTHAISYPSDKTYFENKVQELGGTL